MLTTLAAIYPVVVYLFREHASSLLFACGACCLLLARAFLFPGRTSQMLRIPLLMAVALLGVLTLIDATVAARAYPTVLSLLVAAVFGNSLRHPPSLVERLARAREPELSLMGQAYCRKVTWVWTLWLLANAAIASALALGSSLGLWAIWTGLVSYLVMGALFFGEIALRPWLLGRAGMAR